MSFIDHSSHNIVKFILSSRSHKSEQKILFYRAASGIVRGPKKAKIKWK